MFNFYAREGFRLFPCNIDKTPRVASWRSPDSHVDVDNAERIAATGNYIGAWLPQNYVVIDLDRNHANKPDGVMVFLDLCERLGITDDLTQGTLTVKTGSGGQHLYFLLPTGTDYRTLSQKSIADSVDVRTHLGYVIAAGTNGYSVINNVPPMELPAKLLEVIQTRNRDKARDYKPSKELPVEVLEKILKKIPAQEFNTNDSWQEFVISCIAVSGNSDESLDAIERWSRSDPNYKDDPTVRKRIETFEPSGGITAGTFVHVLKQSGVSKYLINKVRTYVSTQFDTPKQLGEAYDAKFELDYAALREDEILMRASYYAKNQVATTDVFVRMVAGKVLYSQADRAFFYYNGNRWIERVSITMDIHAVLMNAAIHWYTDVGKAQDADAEDALNSYMQFISSLTILQKIEAALKGHETITRQKVDWDGMDLASTLTLDDCVMDFTGESIEFRPGRADEYRKLYIGLSQKDFEAPEVPNNFRSFLKDVFPNDDTRKMATYALSTMVSGTGEFRKFQIWNGPGRNGKSTLMEIMKSVIGERAITYKTDVLLSKTYVQSLTPELAVFRGALVGFASETEEAKHVSQGTVKALTGNETITANPKYKGMIEFKPTFQLVVATNYLPKFSAHDSAFIDRLLILPFNTCFYTTEEERKRAEFKGITHFVEAKRTGDFLGAIEQERAQILYYLAKRYQEVRSMGYIPESKESKAAKDHYIDDNNDIVQFLEDFVEFSETPENGLRYYFTPTKDLVDFYNEENNTRASAKFVTMRLREVYPLAEGYSKMVDGKLTRGIKHVRLKHGAYPEGWQGNYTEEERRALQFEEAEF